MGIESFDKLSLSYRIISICLLVFGIMLYFGTTTGVGATEAEAVTSLIGAEDSILVVDPDGSIVISKNDTKKLIPASIDRKSVV